MRPAVFILTVFFILDEIANFFQNYKVLQGIKVTTGDYHSKEETMVIIEECKKRFQENSDK